MSGKEDAIGMVVCCRAGRFVEQFSQVLTGHFALVCEFFLCCQEDGVGGVGGVGGVAKACLCCTSHTERSTTELLDGAGKKAKHGNHRCMSVGAVNVGCRLHGG